MASINETLRDESIAHALWISRYSTGVASRMVKVLNESDAELSARLIVALETLDPSSFTVQRIETMLVGVREINRQATAAYLNGMTTELRDFAEHEAGFQLSLFDALLPDEVKTRYPLQSVTPEMVYAAAMSKPFQGKLLREWASGLEADRMARISNTIRQGLLLGDTTTQLAKKIRGHANRGYQDGALQMSRSNAASIAKTAVGHVASTAREEFASVNDDLLSGKQWLSTLDNHTTPMCRIRDRLRYTLANKPIGHKIPYLQGPGKIHFCCRSTETLILKSAAELGLDMREISGATRASMDGQIPADTDYSCWFARQPYERQKQIVGQQRARLMRDGGMSPDQFYTDRGDWLTLAQLRERDEQAFIRAGI